MNFRKNGLWLTGQWDFTPKTWGVVGFTVSTDCENFFKNTSDGTIVAIYVTKQNPINKVLEGKVAGFVRLSREKDCSKEFVCEDLWAKNQKNPKTQGKWSHGVQITQAWKTVGDSCKMVDDIFKNTYKNNSPRVICRYGVVVEEADFDIIDALKVCEVKKVFGQDPLLVEPEITTVAAICKN